MAHPLISRSCSLIPKSQCRQLPKLASAASISPRCQASSYSTSSPMPQSRPRRLDPAFLRSSTSLPTAPARAYYTYQSKYHPTPNPPADTFTPQESAILSAAVKHIPEHGFTITALRNGAQDAGYLDASLQLFPRGGEIELVMYYLASKRGELRDMVARGDVWALEEGSETMEKKAGTKMSVDEKVNRLIWERLKLNRDVRKHWQEALAIMSLPSNIPSGLNELYALSSDILYLSGDASIDTQWYTRRLHIATVYASTDFAMTSDDTPDLQYTKEFLERRIEGSTSVFEGAKDVKDFMYFKAHTLFGILRSFGMKI